MVDRKRLRLEKPKPLQRLPNMMQYLSKSNVHRKVEVKDEKMKDEKSENERIKLDIGVVNVKKSEPTPLLSRQTGYERVEFERQNSLITLVNDKNDTATAEDSAGASIKPMPRCQILGWARNLRRKSAGREKRKVETTCTC